MRVIDALPVQWRNSLMFFEPRHKKDFVLNDLIQLRFRKQDVPLSKAVSKTIYVEVRRKFEKAPTAQARFTDQYFNSPLDWKAIYKLPFKVAMDTKTREFQYKILNKYLPTNSFLYKVGLKPSALCTFCDEESETLGHLFIYCHATEKFWLDFISWCNKLNISLDELTDIDKLLGIWERNEDFLLLNHLLLIAKQHIYDCRNKSIRPSLRVFNSKLNYIYQTESIVMKSNNKEQIFNTKWRKYVGNLDA